MRRTPLSLAAAALLAMLAGSAWAGPNDEAAKLMASKAEPIVAVKVVMKLGDFERTFDFGGTVVDESGVVMTPNFSGGVRGAGRMQVQQIRVMFPGEEKEYDAVLGAFDSKLGLAFVRVKDLAGKKLAPVDVGGGSDPVLGEELFGVMRMDEGFDHAPYFGLTTIVGQVSKPRTMWVPQGFLPMASPLYHLDGKVAGVVIQQEGVSEDRSSRRTFLLPVEAAKQVVAQAVKESAKALEKALAEDKPDAEDKPEPEAGMGGDATPGMDAPTPGMEEPAPGMGG